MLIWLSIYAIEDGEVSGGDGGQGHGLALRDGVNLVGMTKLWWKSRGKMSSLSSTSRECHQRCLMNFSRESQSSIPVTGPDRSRTEVSYHLKTFCIGSKYNMRFGWQVPHNTISILVKEESYVLICWHNNVISYYYITTRCERNNKLL